MFCIHMLHIVQTTVPYLFVEVVIPDKQGEVHVVSLHEGILYGSCEAIVYFDEYYMLNEILCWEYYIAFILEILY